MSDETTWTDTIMCATMRHAWVDTNSHYMKCNYCSYDLPKCSKCHVKVNPGSDICLPCAKAFAASLGFDFPYEL